MFVFCLSTLWVKIEDGSSLVFEMTAFQIRVTSGMRVCGFLPVLGGLFACHIRLNSLHMWVDGSVCTWWHISPHVF